MPVPNVDGPNPVPVSNFQLKPMSQERRAVLVASGAAVTLAIAKTAIGLATGSMAVLASAADSLLDFFVSLVNLFAIKKAESPANEKYHYGF